MGRGSHCLANGNHMERHADVRITTRHPYCVHGFVLCIDLGVPLLRQESVEYQVKVSNWNGRSDIAALGLDMRNGILRVRIP